MLSIIIPTLNAAGVLKSTLVSVSSSPSHSAAHEIIVADGGSIDDTVAVALSGGAIVLETMRGRGRQLVAGAAAASGDWLLFLHADTRLQEGWWDTVAAFTADASNRSVAAYFDFSLDDSTWAARFVERMVRLRSLLFALPYGDQGLLIHRNHYERIGGYSAVPLMEDVELIRRIGGRNLRSLSSTAVTSAEKYRRDGYLLRPLINLCMLGLYAAGVSPHHLNRLYR